MSEPTKPHVPVRPGDWFRGPDGALRRARGWCGAVGNPPECSPGGYAMWYGGETTPYAELSDPSKGWVRLGSTPAAALSLEAVVLLAEAAADELEAVGGSAGPSLHVRGAALGLLLLAELGARGFGSGGDHPLPPGVEIGESEDGGGILADGERRIAPYEALLARLGWERDRDYLHRGCDPLGMVYVR